MRRAALLSGLCLALLGFASAASAVDVIFQNDLDPDDKAGALVRVDQVRTAASVGAVPIYVRSGEKKPLARRAVLSFRVSRMQGASKARVYFVECPGEDDERVTVKLLDVHLNRMAGGCDTTRTGYWTSTEGYVWKD